MEKAYLSIVLHAHLPYVRHPEHERFLEEEWFYEAITETYVPLIMMFERLVNDKVKFRITMTLSPTLISMLSDNLLQERYLKHINKLIESGLVIHEGNRYTLRVDTLKSLIEEIEKDLTRALDDLKEGAKEIDKALGL